MTNIATCNTAGLLRALEDGSEEFLAPLLGPDYRHERAGVIRPGIMVLRKYPEDQKALYEKDLKIYEELVAKELTWDEIDKRLGKLTIKENGKEEQVDKLKPLNVDYFTINKGDCVNGANADKIRELYADHDGRVRSLPVWFSTNDWWNLIPHSLRCYGFSGLKHKSAFIPVNEGGKMVGYEMVCESPSPVEPGKRIFGGRDWVQKACIPEDCPDFQARQCTFGGSIQCMIPGVKGIGVWIVPTTSWYSMKAVKNTLNRIWKATGGRLAHLLYEEETIFVLRKVRGRVPVTDKAGNTKLKEQWLISLDVTVDPLDLVKEFSPARIMGRGVSALAAVTDALSHAPESPDAKALEGHGPASKTALTTVGTEKSRESKADEAGGPGETQKVEGPKAADKKEDPKALSGTSSKGDDGLAKQREAIRKQAMRLGCIPEDRVGKRISEIASPDQAAAIIRRLNKGDYSDFVTLEEAKTDLKTAVGRYGLPPSATEPVISAIETAGEACELLVRLNRGDLSQFLSTDDGGGEEY